MLHLYRLTLKQIQILKKTERVVGDHFDRIAKIKAREINQQKLFISFFNSFHHALKETNKQNFKYVQKLLRIYLNCSKILTRDLQFNKSYVSNATKLLDKDLQYNRLSDKQKEVVKGFVMKICEKKPKVRYKRWEDYLNDAKSEDYEQPILTNEISPELKKSITNSPSIFGKTFSNWMIQQNQPLNKLAQQFYKIGVVLI